MPLKNYQNDTVMKFEQYVKRVFDSRESNAHQIIFDQMQREENSDITYATNGTNIPSICIQIPTGGGKTIVACHLLCSLYEKYLQHKNDSGVVIWMVPSTTIQEQTLTALRNIRHPYRRILDEYFRNNVLIFDSDEMQRIRPEEISDNLCIIVTTFSMFRITNFGNRNVYEDSGALMEHFQNITPQQQSRIKINFEGNEIGRESLVNVLRMNKPIIIADESHNAQTQLAINMYENLNPCFHLEYTATPDPNSTRRSNILVNVNAHRLKEEGMVKMPIYLYEEASWQKTIRAAYEKRNELNEMSVIEQKSTGEYIRPILLIQAERDESTNDGIDVKQIHDFLTQELGIQDDEIRTRTGTINDLEESTTLLSPDSHVRYIITVRAISEGWDNVFAYVLATLATLGTERSRIQILGRILRLPNQTRKQIPELNNSYVYTTSHNFQNVSDSIIRELVINGYNKTDMRTDNENENENIETCQMGDYSNDTIQLPCISINRDALHRISFRGDLLGDNFVLERQQIPTEYKYFEDRERTVRFDINQEGDFDRKFVGNDDADIIERTNDFGREEILEFLDRKIKRVNYTQQDKRGYVERILDHELGDPNRPEYGDNVGRLALVCHQLLDIIVRQIDMIEINEARKNFNQFMTDGLLEMIYETLPDTIESFDRAHEEFRCHLYKWAESMNNEERKLAERIDNMKNIKWWFRNREKCDFYIQGWEDRRFYPDFIIKTKSDKYVVVEYKGQYLCNNDDSNYKRELGNIWAGLAGENYEFKFVCANDVNEFLAYLDSL